MTPALRGAVALERTRADTAGVDRRGPVANGRAGRGGVEVHACVLDARLERLAVRDVAERPGARRRDSARVGGDDGCGHAPILERGEEDRYAGSRIAERVDESHGRSD